MTYNIEALRQFAALKAGEQFRRITYNGVTVQATGRRSSSRDDKKYERTVRYNDSERVVHYGDPNMRMRRTNEERQDAFVERHDCDGKSDPFAPGFWACYDWENTDEKSAAAKDAPAETAPEPVRGNCVMLQLGALPEIIRVQQMVCGFVSDAEPVDPETFHITLCYMEQGDITTMVMPAPMPAFSVYVEGVDQFNTPEGYAIHLKVRRQGELEDYQRLVYHAAANEVGVQMSNHSLPENYQPHITLAYSKTAVPTFPIEPLALVAKEVILSNREYQVVAEQALKSARLDTEKSFATSSSTTATSYTWSVEPAATKSSMAITDGISIPYGLDAEEEATYARIYEKVLAITSDVTKATLAAYGAINRLRYGLAVKSRKNLAPPPTGSVVSAFKESGRLRVKGWGVLFGDKAHRDIDTPPTYFAPNTEYFVENYQHAPLWYQHGSSALRWKKIGDRVLTEFYPEHGIWAEHDLTEDCPPHILNEINQGTLAYSSDSIHHYVQLGYHNEDGWLEAWALAGWSLVSNPAEPGLGSVIL